VGGWPVFTANAVAPVPAKTKFVSFDTVEAAIALLRAGKVQVLLGQKYFGWGSEPIRMLHDLVVNGKKPERTVIDSGVDVVTMATVDAYEAQWKKMAGGQ
jgi:ribose transport system substrate-binding protein